MSIIITRNHFRMVTCWFSYSYWNVALADASSFLHYRETALVFIKLVIVIKQLKLLNCDSALVPPQPGEKVVNYPTRPVDTTTDFEGTISLQPSQPVSIKFCTSTRFISLCLLVYIWCLFTTVSNFLHIKFSRKYF